MNELINVNDAEKLNHAYKLATTLSKSQIVPRHFQGKPDDVFATLLLGSELGFQPMQSLQSIVIIQGNATLKAQTMLAIARARLPEIQLDIKTEKDSVTVTGQRYKGDIPFSSTWDNERAKAMGLLGKDNYIKQRLTMFKWRAMSDVLRTIAADVLMGLYSTEEMIDVVETKTVEQDLIEGGKEYLQEYIKNDMEKNPDHYEVGEDSYMVQNAKFRGKQLRDIDPEEMADYLETLEKRENQKSWEKELITSMRLYLGKLNAIKAGI